MDKPKKLGIFFAIVLVLAAVPAYAELVGSETYGYSLDLPEGFVITDSTGNGKGYQFQNTLFPVQVLIRIYEKKEFDSAEKAMGQTLSRLSAKYESAEIRWRHSDCSLAQFQMNLGGTGYGGWGVCVELPEEKGYFALLAYATTNDGRGNDFSAIYEPVILSVVDALYIDRGSFYECGPVTAFAFPPTQEKPVQIEIDGMKINTVLDSDDVAANEFVIEREFSLMKMYAETDYWVPAWQRYYRQIYRDAYGRLKRPAFDLYVALYDKARELEEKDFPAFCAKTLLAWTQNFSYERNFHSSDISPIPAVFASEVGSDCDSRSLLLAILLHQMNLPTVMFVSPVYSHAMLGVALSLPGAKIDVNGTKYLLGETTAQVPIGMVAQEMSVTENWLPIIFP